MVSIFYGENTTTRNAWWAAAQRDDGAVMAMYGPLGLNGPKSIINIAEVTARSFDIAVERKKKRGYRKVEPIPDMVLKEVEAFTGSAGAGGQDGSPVPGTDLTWSGKIPNLKMVGDAALIVIKVMEALGHPEVVKYDSNNEQVIFCNDGKEAAFNAKSKLGVVSTTPGIDNFAARLFLTILSSMSGIEATDGKKMLNGMFEIPKYDLDWTKDWSTIKTAVIGHWTTEDSPYLVTEKPLW